MNELLITFHSHVCILVIIFYLQQMMLFFFVIHHNKNYIFWVFMLGIVVMLYSKTFNHYNNLMT